jgi:type IV pilus assembly protein PilO
VKQLLTKLQYKQQIALFAFIMLIPAVAFYSLVLTEQRAYIRQLTGQAEIRKQQIDGIEKFVLEHPDADRYQGELDQKLAVADQMLPDRPNMSSFLIQLDQTAAASGVKVAQIKPGQPVNKAGYREIPIEIIIKGTYAQTMIFLTKLESLSRFDSVNNIAMQSQQTMLESKLSIVIYSYGVNRNAAGQPFE